MDIQRGAIVLFDGIQQALTQGHGFLAGRFGTIELEALKTPRPGEDVRAVLERNAGVFPSEEESVREWARVTKEVVQSADVLAVGWYAPAVETEKRLLESWGWSGLKVPLRSLEPYYSDPSIRWTRLLEGHDVCVVSSFAQTASSQVSKGESVVWPGHQGSLWPSTTRWHWVQTGYAPCLALGRAGWQDSPESWQEAVDWVVKEVESTKARIVLIGCGGLGMILGGRLKAKGKICIVMGGATQVLFGIKGERWKTHSVLSKFWNPEWVWPSLDETPRGANEIEGACYWKQGV